MSYILNRPFTRRQRLDFIVEHNHQHGREIAETDTSIIALESNEIFVDGEVKINPNYDAEKRLFHIDIELDEIKVQLGELDLKSIRALREGGTNSDGVPYIELYQSQINELRQKYSDLISEKATLENIGGANDISE